MDAAERGDPDGTRSILDLWSVSDRPEPFAASGLTRSELERYFGTAEPSVDDVNDAEAFWAAIERGTGRYVIAFEDGDRRTSASPASPSIESR
jgi:hypothetical protein